MEDGKCCGCFFAQGMTDAIYMKTCDPDVCSKVLGEQGMELPMRITKTSVSTVRQSGRTGMLQGINQVNHYPGVNLFMVTWQHGVAGFYLYRPLWFQMY